MCGKAHVLSQSARRWNTSVTPRTLLVQRILFWSCWSDPLALTAPPLLCFPGPLLMSLGSGSRLLRQAKGPSVASSRSAATLGSHHHLPARKLWATDVGSLLLLLLQDWSFKRRRRLGLQRVLVSLPRFFSWKLSGDGKGLSQRALTAAVCWKRHFYGFLLRRKVSQGVREGGSETDRQTGFLEALTRPRVGGRPRHSASHAHRSVFLPLS